MRHQQAQTLGYKYVLMLSLSHPEDEYSKNHTTSNQTHGTTFTVTKATKMIAFFS
jgi:hypothetical protein